MTNDRHRHKRPAAQTVGTVSRELPTAQQGTALRIKRSVESPGSVRTITVRRQPGRTLVVPRDVPFKVIDGKPIVLQAAYTRVTPAAARQERRDRVRSARAALDLELARVDQCLRSADQHAVVLDVHAELRDLQQRAKKLRGRVKPRSNRAPTRR